MREVSINIPFFNRLDVLSRCVRSIEENTPRDLYELVLINDGSTDEKAVEYAKQHADIFVDRKVQLGIAQSRADGVNVSTCKYICACDDDIIVPPKWLETLVYTFKLDHLHPKVTDLSPNRRLVTTGVDIKILAPLLYGRIGQCMWGGIIWTTNWVLLVGEVGTYCMLFEKSLIDIIGNFDPDLYNLWEDLDFCRRVSKNIFHLPNNPSIGLDTRVVVYHHGYADPSTGTFAEEPGADTRTLPELRTVENQLKTCKSAKIMYERWGVKHARLDIYLKFLKEHGWDSDVKEKLLSKKVG